MGGHINIGIDGPWDGRRIWGTVPVESDGSVNFKAPANTPLAVQPLDADGKAVAVMRSWFTAMPARRVVHRLPREPEPRRRRGSRAWPCSASRRRSSPGTGRRGA